MVDLRWFLRVPLFFKILGANAAMVVAVALIAVPGTTWLLQTFPERSATELTAVIALGALVTCIVVNAVILRLALSPLALLEDTARRVQSGDLGARVPDSPLADRGLERLARTFNVMLDGLGGYRQRLREVAARALDAQEEERKRIARELHDETAQTLAALMVKLRLARGLADSAARDAVLEDVRAEIAAALEGVRRFAQGLRPPALDMLGLAPAIESHVRGLAEATGLTVEARLDPVDGLLTPEAELVLYRIVQEALTNVVRHSGARRVRLRLRERRGHVLATVTDNGRGFAVERVMSGDGHGLGLFGMQERAGYVGGRVAIRSTPGAGTTVWAEVPVTGVPSQRSAGNTRARLSL